MSRLNNYILALVFFAGQSAIGAPKQLAQPKSIRSVPNEKDYTLWLKKASSDLLSAKKLNTDGDTLDTAVYHTQQAAEKALKAYLVFATRQTPRSHDLVELLNLSIRKNSGFKRFRQIAYDLTPYATCHRYPGYECYHASGELCHLTRQEVAASIEKAEAILNFVQKQIKIRSALAKPRARL